MMFSVYVNGALEVLEDHPGYENADDFYIKVMNSEKNRQNK